MAHDRQSTRCDELLQLLCEQGFDGMAEAIEIRMDVTNQLTWTYTIVTH